MDLPVLVPVEYGGELVALVSRERFHIVSPRLAERPAGDPELRFVALMCACWGRALEHDRPSLTSAQVEASTRRALLDAAAMATVAGLADEQAARVLNVPVEQMKLARGADPGAASSGAPERGGGVER